ncbi:unnamed protein product, partial [Polarella glacialis]
AAKIMASPLQRACPGAFSLAHGRPGVLGTGNRPGHGRLAAACPGAAASGLPFVRRLSSGDLARTAGLLGCLSVACLLRKPRDSSGVRMASVLAGSSVRKSGRHAAKVTEPLVLGAPGGVLKTARANSSDAWQSLEHIYCVNLDRRPERWSFMQAQFQRLRMPAERFSAVDGRTLDVPHMAEIGLIAMEALPRWPWPEPWIRKMFAPTYGADRIRSALIHELKALMSNVLQVLQHSAASYARSLSETVRSALAKKARGKQEHGKEVQDANRPTLLPHDWHNWEAPFLVIEDDCQFAEASNEPSL